MRLKILAAALVLLAAPMPAQAGHSLRTVLGAPLSMLGGIVGYHGRYGRHGRHHHRRTAAHRQPKTAPHRQPGYALAPAAAAPAVAARQPARPEAGATSPLPPSGWAGFVFWPDAADDLLQYALWPGRTGGHFWSYGYSDIIEGILPRPGTAAASAKTCGPTAIDWPIERIRQTLTLDDTQAAAQEELRTAVAGAVERIATTCPTAAPGSATERLHAMVRRLRAVRQAIGILRGPVQKFEESLTDEQRARLEAAGAGKPVDMAGCRTDVRRVSGMAMMTIQQTVQPTEDQRMAVGVLIGIASKMAEGLADCPAQRPAAALARLAAAEKRLDAMLYATQNIRVAVHQFALSLSPAQKARFDPSREKRDQVAR